MPYCSRCGVEVDDHIEDCPLCKTPIQKLDRPEPQSGRYPQDNLSRVGESELPPGLGSTLAFQIITILFVTPFLIVLATSLVVEAWPVWASFVLVGLAAAWVTIVTPIMLSRHPIFIVLILFLTTTGLLLTIDLLEGSGIEWFFVVGFPILVLVLIMSIAVVLSSTLVRDKGTNVASFVLLGLVILCMGIDGIISLYQVGYIMLGWSIIVAVSLAPVAIFLLYYHYGIRERIDLRKTFHV